MKLSCTIIDDEPLAVSLLESYANKTPFLDLKSCYNSALEALEELREHPVDLVFLDIQMPELNGMEFSKMLANETRIIFTTAFSQYALDSYQVNALDYLLKPINYTDFLKASNKALDYYTLLKGANEAKEQQTSPAEIERIFIKSEYKLLQIELKNILYIEGLKDYVKIYLEGEEQPILSLMSMKNLEELLPSTRFIRVHRSFIVQPQKIKVIERNRIIYGKTYIPISENYKQAFNNFLTKYTLIFQNSR